MSNSGEKVKQMSHEKRIREVLNRQISMQQRVDIVRQSVEQEADERDLSPS